MMHRSPGDAAYAGRRKGRTTDGAAGETGSTDSAPPRLVVVIGPIASGKSTLAAELADLLRSAGQNVAVVGLDTPVTTVIAEGPQTPAEVDQLMSQVPSDVTSFRVLLTAVLETAQRRIGAEPSRGISRDPEFLAVMYRRFADELPGMVYDVRLRSEDAPPAALATRVHAAMHDRAK